LDLYSHNSYYCCRTIEQTHFFNHRQAFWTSGTLRK